MIDKEKIKNDLKFLSENDVYSLSLGLLYKLTQVPEYAVVSKLPYLLNRESLFNLCEYFGGSTIKIPTVVELRRTLRVLLLYQAYIVEHRSWGDSMKLAGYHHNESELADKQLRIFQETIADYNFGNADEQSD